jgi:hypothetical protein
MSDDLNWFENQCVAPPFSATEGSVIYPQVEFSAACDVKVSSIYQKFYVQRIG